MTDLENSLVRQNEFLAAAIVALLVLTGIMLLALMSRTPPHPPLEVAPLRPCAIPRRIPGNRRSCIAACPPRFALRRHTCRPVCRNSPCILWATEVLRSGVFAHLAGRNRRADRSDCHFRVLDRQLQAQKGFPGARIACGPQLRKSFSAS